MAGRTARHPREVIHRSSGGSASSSDAVPEYRKTKTAGVYVRHQSRCAAGPHETARCRCQPSFRGRRWDPGQPAMVWSDTLRRAASSSSGLRPTSNGADALAERVAAGPSFSSLADEWLDGVRSGAVGRRRGRSGIGYSPTHQARSPSRRLSGRRHHRSNSNAEEPAIRTEPRAGWCG
jgi:hypothetical protein